MTLTAGCSYVRVGNNIHRVNPIPSHTLTGGLQEVERIKEEGIIINELEKKEKW